MKNIINIKCTDNELFRLSDNYDNYFINYELNNLGGRK